MNLFDGHWPKNTHGHAFAPFLSGRTHVTFTLSIKLLDIPQFNHLPQKCTSQLKHLPAQCWWLGDKIPWYPNPHGIFTWHHCNLFEHVNWKNMSTPKRSNWHKNKTRHVARSLSQAERGDQTSTRGPRGEEGGTGTGKGKQANPRGEQRPQAPPALYTQ